MCRRAHRTDRVVQVSAAVQRTGMQRVPTHRATSPTPAGARRRGHGERDGRFLVEGPHDPHPADRPDAPHGAQSPALKRSGRVAARARVGPGARIGRGAQPLGTPTRQRRADRTAPTVLDGQSRQDIG
jgi:hypothetical protein